MPAKLRELSPAKINLFLKIINKRHDGYHNLRSGVTVINLFDEIIAEKSTEFYVNYIGEFAPKKNKFNDCIISKLFKEFNIVKPKYKFTIKKNIPVQSGLGSASSNVAAVLRILEKLGYKKNTLIEYSKIGADIPFFINSKDALIRGIGDIIIDQIFPKYYFLLVKPLIQCSTSTMYNQIELDEKNNDFEYDTNEITEYDYGNDFENIIETKYKEVSRLLTYLKSLPDTIFARLTGSGSCIFAAFESKKNAENSLVIFKNQFPNLWVRVVENNFL